MPKSETSLGRNYWKLYAATLTSNLGDGMAMVAYPWLATALTRNPILVAMIVVAQRLPWLLFTLPAGVITDRVDRRKAIVAMDAVRFVVTGIVAFAVLGVQGELPGPAEVGQVEGTRTGLYLVLILATILLGMAEVLRDNSAQTIMPRLVSSDQLEKANGRLWGAESVANEFIGPPIGSLLLIVAFSIPFFVDAGTFFVAAALVAAIHGTFKPTRDADNPRQSFRDELSEGVRWLMGHSLLRPMAIILGLMNAAMAIQGATFVLFAQEVMGLGPVMFAIIGFGAAIGGFVGGYSAPIISKRLGSGTSLAMVLAVSTIIPLLIGLIAKWPVVMVLFALEALVGTLWNVITVSLRQSIIPEHLLGRVNSVYRFFAWGMIPIGAAAGGVLVWVLERVANRDLALRSTWFACAAIHLGLFIFGRAKLTTAKIEVARATPIRISTDA